MSREQSAACESRVAEDGDKWARNMHDVAVLKIATYNKKSPQLSTSGPPPSKDSKNYAILAEAQECAWQLCSKTGIEVSFSFVV